MRAAACVAILLLFPTALPAAGTPELAQSASGPGPLERRIPRVSRRPWIEVGTRRLFRCLPRDSGVRVAGYCDTLRVPLDRNDAGAGSIGVRFEWIPARGAATTATIVALEGGPGFHAVAMIDGFSRDYRLIRESVPAP